MADHVIFWGEPLLRSMYQFTFGKSLVENRVPATITECEKFLFWLFFPLFWTLFLGYFGTLFNQLYIEIGYRPIFATLILSIAYYNIYEAGIH